MHSRTTQGVTEVSPAAAAAVEAFVPVADTHVNGEAGGSDQAEDTHDSMQEVQDEEPEAQEGSAQAHINESDDPAPYPNGPSTLKRTYFWRVKPDPAKLPTRLWDHENICIGLDPGSKVLTGT